MGATYRKHNDGSLCSSTYHKKDGTNMRAKLKQEDKTIIEEGEEFYNNNICEDIYEWHRTLVA